MNAAEMLDKAQKIIARQDVDRPLLLFFMNMARRALLRDKEITKFYQYLTNVASPGGILNLPGLAIKSVKTVEYDDRNGRTPLAKLDGYDMARRYYPDFTVTGMPQHYLELGASLYVLPVPVIGEIHLLAEVWPADLADSPTSQDITTAELPEAWIYLAAAEYFDYFDELQKGQYWRQKALAAVEQYLKELSNQYFHGLDTVRRGYYHTPYRRGDY